MSGQRPCVVYTRPHQPSIPTILQRRTAIRSSLGWHASALEWAALHHHGTVSGKRQCRLLHLGCVSPNNESVATVALPKDLLVPCLAASTFIVLLLFFFYPSIQLVTHCKASAFHSQVTSIFRHGSCLFYTSPSLPLAQKSVLCAVSLHLYVHLLSNGSLIECFVS